MFSFYLSVITLRDGFSVILNIYKIFTPSRLLPNGQITKSGGTPAQFVNTKSFKRIEPSHDPSSAPFLAISHLQLLPYSQGVATAV